METHDCTGLGIRVKDPMVVKFSSNEVNDLRLSRNTTEVTFWVPPPNCPPVVVICNNGMDFVVPNHLYSVVGGDGNWNPNPRVSRNNVSFPVIEDLSLSVLKEPNGVIKVPHPSTSVTLTWSCP